VPICGFLSKHDVICIYVRGQALINSEDVALSPKRYFETERREECHSTGKSA
jgi:hypothetical protein